MRTIAFVLLSLFYAATAIAADIPVKAPPPSLVAIPASLGGIYVGVLASGAKTNAEFEFLTIPGGGNLRPSGLMAGGLVGFGTWNGSMLIAVEADGSYDFSKADVECAAVLTCKVRSSWFLTQRLVVGGSLNSITGAVRSAGTATKTQWPTVLNLPSNLAAATVIPYVTAGIAERRIEACIEANGCARQWLVGVAGGGGLRIPISAGFSVDLQYLYVRYNKSFTPAGGPVIFPAIVEFPSEHVVRLVGTMHF